MRALDNEAFVTSSDVGHLGIRANAVAPGSIVAERAEAELDAMGATLAAERRAEMPAKGAASASRGTIGGCCGNPFPPAPRGGLHHGRRIAGGRRRRVVAIPRGRRTRERCPRAESARARARPNRATRGAGSGGLAGAGWISARRPGRYDVHDRPVSLRPRRRLGRAAADHSSARGGRQRDPDIILVTHAHGDHLDPPTIGSYGRRGCSTLVAPPAVARIAAGELGWAGRLVELAAGESVEVGGARVTATWTRHGYEDAPGPDAAVGFLIEIDGLSIWHAGDTEYDARLHRFPPGDLDVAFLPINGTGGNMNAYEAAVLAWQLRVGVTVPMHFGMWSADDYTYGATEPWATTDPDAFVRAYRALAPDAAVQVPVPGEVMVFTARGNAPSGGSR